MAETSTADRLSDHRAALNAERRRVAHWRRLVRARLDVAIAVITVPEPLGADGDTLLAGADPDVPRHVELLRSLRAGLPMAEVHQLEALRDLDGRLARYQAEVDLAFAAATDRFVEHLADEPVARPARTLVRPDRG
ncbi:hypothetical protein [Cellulomonas cellasea]|uniref:Uncharacterized protein n=1 Tax=Cellulomonas cellasea TaxID=43670 RepID=A0A7W4UDP6_9CELL|nr:hypothetical protein [Cellulomonas cellasea]MBB2922259.1 hypothetical protein [Cellulomonas cellasea]